jgi:hypothetical protein
VFIPEVHEVAAGVGTLCENHNDVSLLIKTVQLRTPVFCVVGRMLTDVSSFYFLLILLPFW